MRAMLRLFVCVVACVAVLIGAAWAVAQWRHDLVAKLDLADAGRALMAEMRKQDGLESRNDAVGQCIQGKQEVIDALFAGRLSLREAGDEFRRLEDEIKQAGHNPREWIDKDMVLGDDDAAVYGNVLAWAGQTAAHRPELAPRLAQIRAEADVVLHRPTQQGL